jgi:hypothetical protein
VIQSLQERAKELSCLYRVEEILNRQDEPLEVIFRSVIEAIPAGLQYPDVCQVSMRIDGRQYASAGYRPTPWSISVPLKRGAEIAGELEVSYSAQMSDADSGPFLRDEVRLMHAIAERVSAYVGRQASGSDPENWKGAIALLRGADREVYVRVARRMIRHLHWMDVEEAREALERTGHRRATDGVLFVESENLPEKKTSWDDAYYVTNEPFELASRHLSGTEILRLIRTWMVEEKFSLVARVVSNRQSSLADITKALSRLKEVDSEEISPPMATQEGIVVSLIRRFLSDDLSFISKAKKSLKAIDFLEITERTIHPRESRGCIGGKSTGLFLAGRVVDAHQHLLQGDFEVRTPHSWYVSTESLTDFVEYNDLRDWSPDHKYKDLDQIRREYPVAVQLFKHARFSQEMIKGLSMALDDFQGRPIIARSSSLGEDRQGTAFSGKYKSLFLANEGSKKDRLEALLDAIAEIYASIFSPDPIEYRRQRGLLDFDEEMGVLLQEVVGARVGGYYFPLFSGVALSNNEFRWSPRIERADGLLRLVPGLGTRAVDRVGDDYPVLVAPGKPGLRANTSLDEKVRYSPRKVDVIDINGGSFRTLELDELRGELGHLYPGMRLVFSILEGERLVLPSAMLGDPSSQRMVATFEGLLSETTFVKQMATAMKLLEDALGAAVDVEFACDGESLYILQCRAQSYTGNEAPARIPTGLPSSDILFRGHKHISNGSVPDLEYVVYVDPEAYGQLQSLGDLKAVGEAVGRLNQVLPHRRFILMGPGRWGSRGDIRLGVSVTYSDINNTAMLVEIARQKGDYLPDLSFGTHFFQDLVESSIRYLPLYPDDPDGLLNQDLLDEAPNSLTIHAPEYGHLEKVVKVVDIPALRGGRRLHVAMNGETGEAVGYVTEKGAGSSED